MADRDPIRFQVVYDPESFNWSATLGRLTAQTIGPLGRLSLLVFPSAVYLIGLVLFQRVYGLDMFGPIGMASVFLGYAFIVTYLFILFGWNGRSIKRAKRSVYRLPKIIFTLDQDGLTGGTCDLTWDQVEVVRRVPNATALQMQPRYFIILPDNGLPDGLSPEDLRRQIDLWRARA